MSTLSRRRFLKLSAVTALGTAVAACAQPTPTVAPTKPAAAPTATTKPAEPTKPTAPTAAPAAPTNTTAPAAVPPTAVPPTAVPTKPPAAKYKEAPMLADLVKAGKLPPVDQRVPLEPLVLDPIEKTGTYGGKLSLVSTDGQGFSITGYNYQENFVKFKRDMSGKRPNVLTKFAFNDKATEITLYFRKGMKWSDGSDFTVNDWLFWWNDMINDPKINLPKQTGTHVKGEPMKTEKLDDWTLKCTFVAGNPLFMDNLCRGTGARATSWQLVPAAYMKKYHYKYNTALKDTDVKDLLDRYNSHHLFPDMPHFGPWVVKSVKTNESMILERNPYFWKVDTEGNQLPYIDTVEIRSVKDAQVVLLSAINGEVDYVHTFAIKDAALVKENEKKGNYRMFLYDFGDQTSAGIWFHLCYADKGIADLLSKQQFRQAMSYAINKERINDIVFLGLGKVRQNSPYPGTSEFFTARGKKLLADWEKLCIEYDPEKAKKLLDGINVKDVNNDGFRERPDGSALELIIDVNVAATQEVEAEKLIKDDMGKIGLKYALNVIDATLLNQRVKNCESMMRSRNGASSGSYVGQASWAPVEDVEYCVGGQPYGAWYQSGGKSGTPPPAGTWLEKAMQIYDEAVTIVDPAKRDDRLLDEYQVLIDNGPTLLGTVGATKSPALASNKLRNVSDFAVVGAGVYGWPGTGDPEQWYKTP